MKRYFSFLAVLMLLFSVAAQPTLTDLPGRVKRQWRQDVRQAERQAEADRRAGYPIVADPIETPVLLPESMWADAQAIVSWQTQLQNVETLKARMVAECKFPVWVKVSDSGVDETHQDLPGFGPERNYTTEDTRPGNHGTHVAGCIMQFIYPLAQNGTVRLTDCKSMLASGSGSFAWPEAMFRAELAENRASVAAGVPVAYNMSWGAQLSAPIAGLEAAMKANVDLGGVYLFAAAGNSGAAVGYPGSSPQVVCISSLDKTLTLSSFSSRGTEVDACAGGRDILSTVPGGGYGLASGTSMASPSAAGIMGAVALSRWGIARLPNQAALMAYIGKVATKVGDADRAKYGVGYAYISAILDTAPDAGGGNPPPPPPPPPPSDKSYAYDLVVPGPYVIRWQFEGENYFRIMVLQDLKATVTMPGDTPEAAYDEAVAFVAKFFQNRAIVMPKTMTWADVARWCGIFLQYEGRNNSVPITVSSLVGSDEEARLVAATDFDPNSQSARAAGPQLIWLGQSASK